MKMKEFFKKKMQVNKAICRLLVALMVAGIVLPAIPSVGEITVYAETTEPDPAKWATPLANSTSGKTLNTGFYYVKPGTEVSCTNSSSGGNGITISANATVYIYIPEGSRLIAKGGAGSGRTTGGGAGIYVPSTATLVFLGNGEVEATGGKAASGSNGSQGGSASRNKSADTFTTGTGGSGGSGGAGGGAGIGTKGGNGGSGGSGGSGYTVDKDKQTNGGSGSSGSSGSSAASMGKVYKSEGVTVTATGGAAGGRGSGGSNGSNSGPYEWGDPYRGAAGGAGGGGGGGGYAGAAIGTGGPGGAGGGGGAGAGYNWCGYNCGGGGGGGGAGGNGGYGGTRGSVSYLGSWGGNSTRNATLVYTASSGSTGGTTSGGSGGGYSQLRCTANDGTKTNGYSGSGGSGGSSSYTAATSSSITVISTATESKYYKFNVTFEGADENGEQYYYTGRKSSDGNTVTAPGYTAEEDQYFIGWKVKSNGYAFRFNDEAAAEESGALLWDDETFYQKGAIINIASDTYGPVVLEPVVVASTGNKAVSEVLTIEPTEYENATTYLTYQVETLVNGVRKDVGQIALVNDEETYLLNSGSGDDSGLYTYTMASEMPMEEVPAFSVHVNGEDTGIDVTADVVAQVSYQEMQVITRLDGEPSDLPGMVTLADADAPYLAKQDMGTYSYVALENNVDVEREYPIVIGGTDSGHTVSFGETVCIDYSSVQVNIEGNVQVSDVILRNEDARVSIPLEYSNGMWSTIQQVDELAYTVYVNGVKTDYNSVRLDGNSSVLDLGVYKTRFITRKDNVVTDDLVNDIYLGTHLAQRVGVGAYETMNVINPEVDSDALTYYINSAYGAQEAVITLGEEVILDYYTVSYDGGSVHATNVPVDDNVYPKGAELILASNAQMLNLGKTFVGWLVEDTTYAAEEVIAVNDTIQATAVWESDIYTITYVMNDSDMDGVAAVNPNASLVSYTVEDSITLENPTREECTFLGWTYERVSADASDEDEGEAYSELTPVTDLTIPAGYTGDITFEAHWSLHQYNIDVDVAEYDFGSRVEGYASSTLPEAITVTVTNVGNQPVNLDSVTCDPVDETIVQSAFICSNFSATTLAVGDTATFTIRPKTGVALGEYEETVTVKTTKGTEAYVSVKFEVGKDITAPELSVNIGADSWSEFNDVISNADMKKYGDATTITINATDAESPMGSVQYYLAKEPMTQSQLEALRDTDWQTYTAPFTITDNKQFILYARAYDTADPANVVWVSTDLLEIDTIAPVIKGVQAGTYYGETAFTVEDANLDTVVIGGTVLTPDASGVYTLPVEKGVKRNLVATDIHGHATTIEVTVNNIKYEISYDANGGAGTMAANSIESGDSLALPAVKFTAPNSLMEFAYWTIQDEQSNTEYAVGTNYTVTGAVTFVANWIYKEYSIAYDLQGGEFAEGVNAPASYTGADETFVIPTPSRFGYDFAGWTWEGQTTPVTNVTIETGGSADYEFTANWTESTEAKYVVRHWLMKANANAGEDEYELKEEVEYVGEHATSATPEVAMYVGFTSPIPITITLDAKQEAVVDYYYTRNIYQMDVVVDDTVVESVTGVYGSVQNAIVANAAGYGPLSLVGLYDFAGNQLTDVSQIAPVIESVDGADSVTALMPAQNIKIVLGRIPVEYHITYDLKGGEVLIGSNPDTYKVDTEAFYLTAPEKDGYVFAGWTWPGQEMPVKEVWVDTSMTANLTYFANWSEIEAGVSQGEYLVNHHLQNLDGSYTIVESECCYGEIGSVVTPSRRSYLGYTMPDEITVTVYAENTDDVNYYYNRQSYTLTWNLGVGVSGVSTNLTVLDVDPVAEGNQVYYGTPIEATAILGNGYLSAAFTGFGESEINKKSFTMPAQNVSITVTGTPRIYTITYQLAGGSFEETAKAEYNVTEADYTVPVPVKTGYTFAGWTVTVNGVSTDGTTAYIVDTEMCADIILNARWTANETVYTVRHYKENPDGSGYTEVLADTESGTATVGTVVTPAVKNYRGYVSPATVSVTVLADGTTEVVYKYDLVEYVFDNDEQNADNVKDIQDKIDEITGVMKDIEDSYTDINDQIANNNAQIEENKNQIKENNDLIEGSDSESEKEQLANDNAALEEEIVRLESVNEALELQKQEGLNADEVYVYFKGKKMELEALLEEITQTQDDLTDISDKFENSEMNPGLEEVTSDDKQNLQDLVDSIDELLEADPNYLSEEEKNELLGNRAELIEKLQQIEETEKSLLEVKDQLQYLPPLNDVTSDNEQSLQDLMGSIDEVLQSTNLTQEEKENLLAEKKSIQDKLDKIEEVKSELNNLQNRDDAVNKETVTTDDMDTIESLIQDLQQALDDNENNMTEAEEADLKNRISALQDELNNLEQLQENLAEINSQINNMPENNGLTTDDKYALEDLVDEIDTLLSDNNVHMTEDEKSALDEKREEILEMLEEIERIQNAIDDVFNKDAQVDIMDNVSSKDLQAIEEAQNIINELLQNESGHLTDDQKQALQETLDILDAKKEVIEEYAELIDEAKESANVQTPAEEVKEADRKELEDADQKLDELLGTGHLSDAEREELSELAEEVQEKLDRLNAAKDAKDTLDNTYEDAALPGADSVETDDLEIVEDMCNQVQNILDNYSNNMTPQEVADYEELSGILQEMRENITRVKDVVEFAEANYPTIPTDENLSLNDKELIDEMVTEIKDVLENYNGNLTEDQKTDLESMLSDLESKQSTLQDTADQLDNIDQMVEQLPEMGAVNSDNKESMEDLLSDIEEMLSAEPCLLPEETKDTLNQLKKELQDAIKELEEVAEEFSGLQETISNAPTVEEVKTTDKEELEQLVEDIEQMLEEKGPHLSEEEKKELEQLKETLEEAIEKAEEVAEEFSGLQESGSNAPTVEEVKTTDKEDLKQLVDDINQMLEEKGTHLTDEEKNELEQLKETLEDAIEKAEEVEEEFSDLQGAASNAPTVEEVKTTDKEELEQLVEDIEQMLEEEGPHLSEEEKNELQQQKETLEEAIEKAEEVAEEFSGLQESGSNAPTAEDVKTTDKEDLEQLVEDIEQMLIEDGTHLSEEEKKELEQLKETLEEAIEKAEEVAEEFSGLQESGSNAPTVEDVKTTDKEELELLVEDIEQMLEEDGTHLTDEEKNELQQLKETLEEAIEKAEEVSEEFSGLQESGSNAPTIEDVKTTDKEELEQLVEDIEQMLEEDGTHLSEEEKNELQQLKEALEEAIEKAEEVSEEFSGLQESGSNAPTAEDVKTTDKEDLEQLVEDIRQMLDEEGPHLTEEEKNELQQLKETLEEAIEKAEEVAEEFSDLQGAVENVPSVEDVKTTDKELLEQLVADIDRILEEKGTHLSEEEQNALLRSKEELQEKLASIEVLKQEMAEVVDVAVQIPEKGKLKIGDKVIVQDAISLIDEFVNDYGTRLSQEELAQLEDEKAALQDKLAHIENLIKEENRKAALKAKIEAETEAIDNAFNAINALENPGMDDVPSMQQIIDRIDQFIADMGTNLSQDERNHLASIKSLLQEKINTVYEQEQNADANDTEPGEEDEPSDDDTAEGEGDREADENGDENETTDGDASEGEGAQEAGGNGEYIVEIYSGQKLVKRITGLKEGEALDLSTIEDGIYTIVTINGTCVETRMLVVKKGESNIDAVKGVGNKETEVKFTEEEYRMAVEGLEQVYAIPELHEKLDEVLESGGSCTIRFVIQEPKKTPGMDEMKNRAKDEKHKLARVFDFSVAAHIYATDGTETVIPISDTETLLLTAIPLEEFEKGKAKYYVYRSHEWEEGKGEVVEMLPELVGDEMQNPTKEGFYVDGDYVYIWASKYSTYALAYDEEQASEDCCEWCCEWCGRWCCEWFCGWCCILWRLLVVLVVLVGVKKYRDYIKDQKEDDKT